MFRRKGDNLHFIFVLLFLTVALFFLEHQDAEKYARLFSFDAPQVMAGEAWRLVTYQFTQSGQGWMAFPKPLVLFFTLLLLYIMGAAIEAEWGTRHFVALFLASTLGSAGAAAILGVPLLGSYFVNFTLLFVYAAAFPEQTFYLLGIIPIRIRWLAWIALALLLTGVFLGGAQNKAALAGALAAYGYYLLLRQGEKEETAAVVPPQATQGADGSAIRNAARFVGMKRALAAGSVHEIDRLIGQAEREVVRGVNICPPVDYKPENADGYCIRCEGFAECAARFLRMHRPIVVEAPAVEAQPVTEFQISNVE